MSATWNTTAPPYPRAELRGKLHAPLHTMVPRASRRTSLDG